MKAELKNGALRARAEGSCTLRENLAVMRQLVPTTNEVPALLEQVSTAARRAGLDLPDVAPAGPQPGEQFDTYKYKVGVLGGYHELRSSSRTSGR